MLVIYSLSCFLWGERLDGWRPPSAPKKQWNLDQLLTHLLGPLYRYPLTTAASMTAERGAW